MRRALELDPLSFLVNRRMGATLYLARQYDAALSQMQRAAEMEHQPGSIDNYLSLIYEQKGDHDKAVEHDLIALHESSHTSILALFLAYTRSADGNPIGARVRKLHSLPQPTPAQLTRSESMMSASTTSTMPSTHFSTRSAATASIWLSSAWTHCLIPSATTHATPLF